MYNLYKDEEIDGITVKTFIASADNVLYKNTLALACLVDVEQNYYNIPVIQKDYGFFVHGGDYDVTVYYMIRKEL